jgi:hypothetical protein
MLTKPQTWSRADFITVVQAYRSVIGTCTVLNDRSWGPTGPGLKQTDKSSTAVL